VFVLIVIITGHDPTYEIPDPAADLPQNPGGEDRDTKQDECFNNVHLHYPSSNSRFANPL